MKLYRVLGREGKITIPHAMRQHIGFTRSFSICFLRRITAPVDRKRS